MLKSSIDYFNFIAVVVIKNKMVGRFLFRFQVTSMSSIHGVVVHFHISVLSNHPIASFGVSDRFTTYLKVPFDINETMMRIYNRLALQQQSTDYM